MFPAVLSWNPPDVIISEPYKLDFAQSISSVLRKIDELFPVDRKRYIFVFNLSTDGHVSIRSVKHL